MAVMAVMAVMAANESLCLFKRTTTLYPEGVYPHRKPGWQHLVEFGLH
jgi:hypothetical protein